MEQKGIRKNTNDREKDAPDKKGNERGAEDAEALKKLGRQVEV